MDASKGGGCPRHRRRERAPSGLGRPSKLMPELTQRIKQGVGAGMSPETAAALAGVSHSTFFEWQRLGRAEQERIAGGGRACRSCARYLELVRGIEEASAAFEARAVTEIARHGQRSWGPWRYLLERRDRRLDARLDREHAQATGTGGGFGQILEVLAERREQSQAEARTDPPWDDIMAGAKQILEKEPQMPVYASMRFGSAARMRVNATVLPAA